MTNAHGLAAGDLHPPQGAIDQLVTMALAEDLTPLGDLTAALIDPSVMTTATFSARVDGVLAGVRSATAALAAVSDRLDVQWHLDDGAVLKPGEPIGTVTGPLRPLVTAERTALNFLTHLSGIATLTAAWVAVADGRIQVWDTRKTTPGWRALEKAAVRAGGGRNHRGNLSDWVMIKDNHLTTLSVSGAIAKARDLWPARTIQIECDTHRQVAEALEAGADLILLDNMSPAEIVEAVALADRHAEAGRSRRPLLEISGGITLDTLDAYADCGADLISSSKLTTSAPALDIGLDIAIAVAVDESA